MPAAAGPPLITLLTDFGLDDGYVAAMKGVILARAPGACIVDVSHAVAPQDVLHGGLLWSRALPYFPRGAVHVAVVDPGVGSRRRILAVEARGCIHLVPDNGLIGCALSRREVRRVFAVTRRELFLEEVSATFHGRDVFAPVAAALAGGLPLERLGPQVRRYAWVSLPRPRRRRAARGQAVGGGGEIVDDGEVLHIDRFGSAITNLRRSPDADLVEVVVAGARVDRLSRTFTDVRRGALLVLIGSGGTLEVAVREGSAAEKLDLQRGARVEARWRRR